MEVVGLMSFGISVETGYGVRRDLVLDSLGALGSNFL